MRKRAARRKVVRSVAVRDPEVVSLGRGIAFLRSRRQLSRKGLASRLEVTYTQLGFWERGVSQPSIPKLRALTRILGASLEELIEAGDPEKRRVQDGTAGTVEPSPQAG